MKILTQEQAHKQFPERQYNVYDPMILIVGTRKEFQKLGVQTVLHVGNQKIKTPVRSSPLEDDISREPYGTSLDVDKPKDVRLVVWK